ncbi:MAG: Lrp/AsnC family transcriptional regulator [Nanoarchaeota archaeon]|nr:Lrp/AsnC family transcriptional regulator [Nanoarchaeota archaeon]MBU1322057.1 Lrp/AsnC family transcriptional regulator [Nanoarchaeota archaeon]MBU1597249.1 Lrp/AsnC family transcriptional regulator [Nanoarchaeota archaeon]MBU2440706.1 Lrp/AsnC family transcriptional regulator [Nanoarchaeota archaeon]
MRRLLRDEYNLKILKAICSGVGVSVNLSYLSRNLKKHRNTIKTRVEELFKHKIINHPIYPFFGQYREHPLLVLSFADLPHTPETLEWMEKDKHIFAAFKIRKGQYNTLVIMFHRDILNYQLWREHLTETGKIPPRDIRTPSKNHFFSNQLIIKYEPSEGIIILKSQIEKNGFITLNNHKINDSHIKILELLLNGKGIRVNDSVLAKKLNMHKKTIRRRINLMLKNNLILNPVCRFPSFFVPPGCVLQITKVEINKNKKEVLKFLKTDPHIPLALHICEGRFNYLLFEIFFSLEEHVEWSSHVREKFIDCIGTTDTTVLMEKNTFHIDQQKVSLGAIDDCMKALKQKKEDYFKYIEPGYLLFE